MADFNPKSDDAIHVQVDDPAVAPLIDGYLARRRDEVAHVRDAVGARDFGRVRIIGHNLHGSGGAYCLDQLSEYGKALEIAADGGDADRMSDLVDEIGHYLGRLVIDVPGED